MIRLQKKQPNPTGTLKTVAGLSVVALALVGCNSDNSRTGSLSLDVTDAPIDSADAVNVVFEGVDIRAASGALLEITYDEPKTLNLLDYQGGAVASLLDDETLAAGDYEWIRLRVDASREAGGSNIVLDDGAEHDLFIPSGSQTGLKLVSGFTVPVDGSVAFTIDFDLRRSIVVTGGPDPSYRLKPTLRLLDNSRVGSISGEISSNTLTANCDSGAAVYVYEGENVVPGDVGGEGNEPLITALVDTTETNATAYGYKVAFLTEGDYTIAFTCDANLDVAEDYEGEPGSANNDLNFINPQNASVVVDESTTINF